MGRAFAVSTMSSGQHEQWRYKRARANNLHRIPKPKDIVSAHYQRHHVRVLLVVVILAVCYTPYFPEVVFVGLRGSLHRRRDDHR